MDTNLIKESLASIKERIAAIEQALAAPPVTVAPVIVAPAPVATFKEGTAHQAGLSSEDCLRMILRKIRSNGGEAQMQELYRPVELRMNKNGWTLSFQGKSTVRNLVNEIAVAKGYIKAYDPKSPGWRITQLGEAF